MSSANSESFIFLFQSGFISFSALIAMAKTSKTMLNSSGESVYPCLVPDFRENAFNFSSLTSLVTQMVKCLPTMRDTQVQSLGWEDLLEKEMASHSSILAWEIPWTEETGRLQSTAAQRVGHD